GGGKEADLGFLNKYSGKGKVKINSLSFGKTVLSNFVADVKFGKGVMTLAQSASAWGGTIQSNTSLSGGRGLANYTFNGSVKNIDLVKMATMYGEKNPKLKGSFHGSLNLKGAGTSKASLKKYLNGSGAVRITEGEIADLNVGKQVQLALATVSALSGTKILKEKFDRKFQRITADISVGNGKINATNAVAVTSQMEMVGNGYADLDENLNFHGKVLVPPESVNPAGIDLRDSTGKVPIPFQLTGTVSDPNLGLDITAFAAHVALKYAEKELKKRILGEAAGQVIKPKKGGGIGIPIPNIPLPF
ncbi:AsmA-like C-terminal region-containing protein, partial [Bdellovibrionota bacterium]